MHRRFTCSRPHQPFKSRYTTVFWYQSKKSSISLLPYYFLHCLFESLDMHFCSPNGLRMIWNCSRVSNSIRMNKLSDVNWGPLSVIICSINPQHARMVHNSSIVLVVVVTSIGTTSSHFEKASTAINHMHMHMCPLERNCKIQVQPLLWSAGELQWM